MSHNVGGYPGSASPPPPRPEGAAASVNPSLTGVVVPVAPEWTAMMHAECPICGTTFEGPLAGVVPWPPPPLNVGCSNGHDEVRILLKVTRTDEEHP